MGSGSARAPNFGCVRGTKPSFFTFARENSGVQPLPQQAPRTEIDGHGVLRGDTGRILTRWRYPEASRVALDLLYWVMRSAPYRRIRMAIEMAREAGPFISFVDFMSCTTVAKQPCYGPLKIKPSYIIVHYYVIS